MKKNPVIFLFALCPLVPVSARFGYALVMALALCWYFLTGIAFRELVKKLDLSSAGPTVELVALAFSATAYYLILRWLIPTLAVSLGLYVFVSAFSYLLLLGIDTFSSESLESIPLLQFVPTLILFSAIRELLGFGTISLPVPEGLMIVPVLPGFTSYGIRFWGTTGGAFILLGVLAWAAKYFHRRITAYRRNA
jgi:Na+-translocating ferredoxin:NAD+ oxidoreductase RnfE subunit